MNLLLDTHTLIWIFEGRPDLSQVARDAVADGRNAVFVSAVTAWEIAIKRSIGKLRLQGDFLNGLKRYRFIPLDITIEHALAVEALPAHHRDPFDRLLVAQAQLEKLTLVTRDSRIRAYEVQVIEP